MSLSVTESCAVNDLLNWILQRRAGSGKVPANADALKAAKILVAGANKRLMAGLAPRDLDLAWGRSPRARLDRVLKKAAPAWGAQSKAKINKRLIAYKARAIAKLAKSQRGTMLDPKHHRPGSAATRAWIKQQAANKSVTK